MRYLLFLLFFAIVLTGCSSKTDGEAATSYPSAVTWNNSIYGLSSEEMDVKEVGKEIGKIERQRTPMPQKNGESNTVPAGSLIFEVKGADTQVAIAVKANDKYFKATKNGPFEPATDEAD